MPQVSGARGKPASGEAATSHIGNVEVRPEESPQDAGRAVLTDDQGRSLIIVIGKPEEQAIQRGTERKEPPRPKTHELLLRVLGAFNISVQEARVTDLCKGIFYGEIVLERDGEARAFDCRPSDALALAVMAGAKVSVAETVMAKCCVRNRNGSPAKPEDAWSIPLPDMADSNRCVLEIAERIRPLPEEAFDRLVGEVGEVDVLLAAMPVVRLASDGKRSPVPDEVREAVRALRARFDPGRLEEADRKLGELLRPRGPTSVKIERQTTVLQALIRIERDAASP